MLRWYDSHTVSSFTSLQIFGPIMSYHELTLTVLAHTQFSASIHSLTYDLLWCSQIFTTFCSQQLRDSYAGDTGDTVHIAQLPACIRRWMKKMWSSTANWDWTTQGALGLDSRLHQNPSLSLATLLSVRDVYRCHNSKTRKATVDFFCGAKNEVILGFGSHTNMRPALLYLTAQTRVLILQP